MIIENSIIVFTPRSNAHMRLPVVKPGVLEGGPLEQLGSEVLKLWPRERLRVRAVRNGGVIAEFMRRLVLVPEHDFQPEEDAS